MRDTFFKTVEALMREHEDILFITGDLGFGVINPLKERFPDRFLNAGIAEASMLSISAGLALSAKTVFVYSIGVFPTLRCLEQIRNDCAYHNANVKIVSVGEGFTYGALGMSHHLTEDIAVVRALPGITIFSPGDNFETEACVKAAYDTPGACYLRLGRYVEEEVHSRPLATSVLKGQLLREGKDAIILATSGMLLSAKRVIDSLCAGASGLDVGLMSFPTLKPIDKPAIEELARNYPVIFTIEEHNLSGGFGSIVAEVLACMNPIGKARLVRLGLADKYCECAGSQAYLRTLFNLDEAGIKKTVLNELGRI